MKLKLRLFSSLLAIVLLAGLLPAPSTAGPPYQQAQVHPDVWQALESEGTADVLVQLRIQADLSGAARVQTKEAQGRYVYETLLSVARESQRELLEILDARGVDYRSFYIVNAIQVRVDGDLVRSLSARSDVARIMPNPWVKGIPDNLDAQPDSSVSRGIESSLLHVNADQVWALGFSGQGIVVAGQDTGYDWEHPALISQYRGWDGTSADHNYSWHDAIHEDSPGTLPGNPCSFDAPAPCDDHGHGTHTMGTMVGDDGGNNQIGMAPGAQWIGCRNMEQGVGSPATYMECFEFFLAPYPLDGTPDDGNPDLAPHVVNNSWSCPPQEGCTVENFALIEQSIEALRQAGVVIVVSAGNYGSACGTVSYPAAIYQQSFTIGAYDHIYGQIASFSGRGPATYDGETYLKPDLAAPGVGIRSSVPNGAYGYKSGTSMAAPHVAGAVALLLSAAPNYAGDVDAIEQFLTDTAIPRTTTQLCGDDGPGDVPNNVWGWGSLDALAAVDAAAIGLLQGTVTSAADGAPIEGARIIAQRGTLPDRVEQEVTDPTGFYTMTLLAGSYTVMIEADGFFPQTLADVQVASGGTTTQDSVLTPLRRLYLPIVFGE